MDQELNGRATTATLDRRVERLETAQAETNRTVDKLALGQDHLRELVLARFSTLDAQAANTSTKLDRLFELFQNDNLQQARDLSNWRDTPPGKEYTAEMAGLKEQRDSDSKKLEKIDLRQQVIEKKMYAVTIIIGILVIVANIAGPIIVQSLFGVN